MRLDRGKSVMQCSYCRSEAEVSVAEEGVQIVGPSNHNCPLCKKTLMDGAIENQPVLFCEFCRGLLISMEKFQPLVDRLRALRDRPAEFLPRNDADADRSLGCPLCNKTMLTHPYGGPGNVNIETCETCSMIWFDRNELQRIVMAADPKPVPVYSRSEDERQPRADWTDLFVRSWDRNV
jgi:Zn-finger nucleic acid-binding protein